MNRRGFLSFLGGTAAALTLDPEKLLWRPGAKLISIPRPRIITAPPLTFSMLDRAYMECTFGNEQPDRMTVSPKLYAEIMEHLYRPMDRYMGHDSRGLLGLQFNHAIIARDPYMADDAILMSNHANPLNPKLNKIIELSEVA